MFGSLDNEKQVTSNRDGPMLPELSRLTLFAFEVLAG